MSKNLSVMQPAMGATESKEPPTCAGATPQGQPTKTHKSGGVCRRVTFKHAVPRFVCCSNIELGAKEAEKGGGSGLVNALVCCSKVEYDSDAEENKDIKGGGGGGGGGGAGMAMESASFWCSSVGLHKKKKI